MPGDTLQVNTKSVTQNTYDAIVIGSGISGGWAAKGEEILSTSRIISRPIKIPGSLSTGGV